MTSVINIIEMGLRQRGFDGLVNPDFCGCEIGDISPGNCLTDKCQAGYKHTHSKTGEWIMSTRKEGVSDDEIQQCLNEA